MSNSAMVRNIYLGYIDGKVEAILACLHEDINWASEAACGTAPWHGVHRGKSEVREFFARLRGALEVTDFSPISLAEHGDEVHCVVQFGFQVRANGQSGTMQLHHWWRFREGKVYHYRGTEDTELLARLLSAR